MSKMEKVLIVDDSSINRKILCEILQSNGYLTLEAENGKMALDYLEQDLAGISLVLLDIAMPVMDGFTLLDKMTANGMIKCVPVIMTTGADDEAMEVEALVRGASDYIKKPYNPEMVRRRVDSILRLWDNATLLNKLEIDTLTGVYNKDFFYLYAEELLNELPNDKYYILYTDIDDFKIINARYGTSTGDKLLKYLANKFSDLTKNSGICGRISGDMFVLLVKDQANRTQEEARKVENDVFEDSPVKGFQLKIGVYPVKDRTVPIADMCDRAKLAADTVKHQYGMYFAVYNDSMLDNVLREHQLADCMEDALVQKQFVVYLQPKHSTDDQAVAGAEALVRWNHPTMGFISPGEFIPLFEHNGFITKLDSYMLRETCKIIQSWIKQGIKPVPVSVNVSRADFVDDDLPETICECIDSYNLPHKLIHLEVTESAYTDNPHQIISAVSALRDMGFLIEMDDFGSGYSSLNMLSELPIDILKLDMRFMQSGTDKIGASKRDILSFILSLSKWLQLPTIAEGVETQSEFELLKSMGCNYIQGYYFSKPKPAEEFLQYMKNHQIVKKPRNLKDLPTL